MIYKISKENEKTLVYKSRKYPKLELRIDPVSNEDKNVFSFLFDIGGMSKTAAHQILNSGLGSSHLISNKRSFKNFWKRKQFITPPSISENEIAKAIYLNFIEEAERVYNLLTLNLDIPPSEASYLIPECREVFITFKVRFEDLQVLNKAKLCKPLEVEFAEIVEMMKIAVQDSFLSEGKVFKIGE